MFKKRFKKFSILLMSIMMLMLSSGITINVKAQELGSDYDVDKGGTLTLSEIENPCLDLSDDPIAGHWEVDNTVLATVESQELSSNNTYNVEIKGLKVGETTIRFRCPQDITGGIIIPITATLTVNPANTLLNITDYDGIYDGDPHSIEVETGTGAVSIEYSTVAGIWGNQKPVFSSVGQTEINVRVTYQDEEVKEVTGTVTITPETLIINADSAEKVYGEADPVITGSVQGLISGDLFPVDFGRTDTKSGEDAGLYERAFEVYYTPNANYVIEYHSGDFTIHKKAATITVDDSEKVYGATDPIFTGTVEGLVSGDTLAELTYIRVGTDKDAGEYVDVLSATFEGDPNYDVSVINANFTIHPIVTIIYEDTKGNELDKLTLNGQLGKDWTSEQKDFAGYKFKEAKGATEGKYTKETQEVTYVYYTVIAATEIVDTATTKIPATEIEDTATTKIPATEIEDIATMVDTKKETTKETTKDGKLPSTGMSNTFTIMNIMMIGAGVVLKTLNKKEED